MKQFGQESIFGRMLDQEFAAVVDRPMAAAENPFGPHWQDSLQLPAAGTEWLTTMASAMSRQAVTTVKTGIFSCLQYFLKRTFHSFFFHPLPFPLPFPFPFFPFSFSFSFPFPVLWIQMAGTFEKSNWKGRQAVLASFLDGKDMQLDASHSAMLARLKEEFPFPDAWRNKGGSFATNANRGDGVHAVFPFYAKVVRDVASAFKKSYSLLPLPNAATMNYVPLLSLSLSLSLLFFCFALFSLIL